ncbi:MAG: cysteine synthase A [SAR202 cluster bacterium Io17-Chloro-G3]|nr:MAG: cysteine synthase A [SAR202 cluster bacterium Io17-Chloro-G3]
MARLASSVLDLIGNTPLISLTSLGEPGFAKILGKIEALNPGGSVKDRVALAMVRDAEEAGALRPGNTIVESTSGNMGIALATVGAAKGYPVLIVMPESVPPQWRKLLTSLDAAIQLTPSQMGMETARIVARRIVEEKEGYVCLNQFENPSSVEAHRVGTAREILEATDGKVDALVAGVGTGGTITGVGEALMEANPSIQIVAVEPSLSPLLSQGRSGSHGIPGIGANFIPPILNRSLIHKIITVTDEDALNSTGRLARELGLLVGLSSGANVYASLQVARCLDAEKTVVTLLPDRGALYA